jgi:hypothetical protein
MNDSLISTGKIMDCLKAGVSVCDRDLQIVNWNKFTARVTSWRPGYYGCQSVAVDGASGQIRTVSFSEGCGY